MSYDLIPRNKNTKEKRVGLFSWPMILQKTGMGYILGYGSSLNFGQYVYNEGNYGSPVSNDGYKVSSFEAKSMAKVARGFVSVQRFNLKQWNELDEETKEYRKNLKDIYDTPWHEDRLKEIEEIAKFMENSSGFRIY